MKAAIAAGAVAVILGAVGVWFAMRQEAGPGPIRPAASGPARLPFARQASWPTFRGDGSLSGVAAGELDRRLKLYWRTRTGGSIKSSPVIADGRVFVGSEDGRLYAMDLATGRKLWAYETSGPVEAPPLVVDAYVIVGSQDGTLYCLLAADGALRWKYDTGAKILAAANSAKLPGADRTLVLVGGYDSKLHCVELATGEAIWTHEIESYINGSSAVAGEVAVFGGCDNVLHAVGIGDGRKLAAIATGSPIAGSVAAVGREVYAGSYGGQFFRADIEANAIVWTYEGDGQPFYSSPAVASDRVVVGSRDGKLHCLSRRTGERLWSFPTRGDVDSSPVVCGDKVVVGSADGRLYVLELADGKEIFSHDIGGAITSSPAVAGGAVVIGCQDGYVYAFGSETAEESGN